MISTRRGFLAGGALSLASSAGAYSGPIIDTHVHFYDPGRPQGVPWPPQKDSLLYRRTLPEDFRRAAAGSGITGVVIVEASAWLEDNQWVLDLAQSDPLVVGVVGHLDPGKKEFRDHLTRFAKSGLFRGIRLNGNQIKTGLNNPEWIEDLRRLSGADLQLDAIGGEAMFADLMRLSDRIPRLRIVIDHLPFYSPARTTIRELAKRPQIYAKVSGVLRVPEDAGASRAALDELWDVFGSSRVIYGSNWPVSNRMGSYPAVLRVVKDYFVAKGPDAAASYFWKNSLAAYNWVKR